MNNIEIRERPLFVRFKLTYLTSVTYGKWHRNTESIRNKLINDIKYGVKEYPAFGHFLEYK